MRLSENTNAMTSKNSRDRWINCFKLRPLFLASLPPIKLANGLAIVSKNTDKAAAGGKMSSTKKKTNTHHDMAVQAATSERKKLSLSSQHTRHDTAKSTKVTQGDEVIPVDRTNPDENCLTIGNIESIGCDSEQIRYPSGGTTWLPGHEARIVHFDGRFDFDCWGRDIWPWSEAHWYQEDTGDFGVSRSEITHIYVNPEHERATFQALKCGSGYKTREEDAAWKAYIARVDAENEKWTPTFSAAQNELQKESEDQMMWVYHKSLFCSAYWVPDDNYDPNSIELHFDEWLEKEHRAFQEFEAAKCMKMCMDAWTGCWGVALKFLEVPEGSRKGCIFLKEKCEPADPEALDKQGNIWHVAWKAAVSDIIDMSVTTVNPLNHVTAAPPEGTFENLLEDPDTDDKGEVVTETTTAAAGNTTDLAEEDDGTLILVAAGVGVAFVLLFVVCLLCGTTHGAEDEYWENENDASASYAPEGYVNESYERGGSYSYGGKGNDGYYGGDYGGKGDGGYGYGYDDDQYSHSGRGHDEHSGGPSHHRDVSRGAGGSHRRGDPSKSSKKSDDDKAPIDGVIKWLFGDDNK
ncbi:unnamed protein product [Amoebophrya sp. A120]|nr:unnamed protein product [Amoebophrya sp. A120]|eukprot:GSA120T00004125001.1